jgi:hypothetical protein
MLILACLPGLAGAGPVDPPPEDFSVEGYRSVRKYALIVGINEYKSKDIPALRYAVRDANALYKVITDPRRGDFPDRFVTLLTDSSGTLPTAANIGRSLTRIRTQARENDLVLVFFSGHGYEEGGRAYLLPTDADLEALDYTAIERDAFVRQIDNIVANKVVVVLDACHAGGISRGGKGVGEDAALSGRYYDQFSTSQGRAFIASCSGGQLSWEDEKSGHGVFTESLVRGLAGDADTTPEDGLVTLFELRRFLEEDVSGWARRHGKEQQPQVNLESAYGDMPLALNSDYLDSRAQWLAERQATAAQLKVGLVSAGDLESKELAQAVDVLDRMAAGDSLTVEDEQWVEFIRNLVGGQIDVRMYRSGVKGLSPTVIEVRSREAIPRRNWFIAGGGGMYFVAGSEFAGGAQFAPSVRLGYSLGRWAILGSYLLVSGDLEEGQEIDSFTAHLFTFGPRLNVDLSPRMLAFLQVGLGGYMGSEVRQDRTNFALDAGGGLDIRLSRRFTVALSLSWIFSNAALILPTEPELGQAVFAGVGISYAGVPWSN